MYSSFFSTIDFVFVLWCKQMENNKQYLLKYMLHRDYKLFIMNYTNVFVQKFTWTNTSWAQAQAELGCGFRRLHVPPFQISDILTSSKWRWSQVRRDNISSMILMILRHYWLWSSWAWQWSLHTSTSSRHFYHTQHNIVIFSCLNKFLEVIENVQISTSTSPSTIWKVSEIIHSSELKNKDRLIEKNLLTSKIVDWWHVLICGLIRSSLWNMLLALST